jgi:hypothetical protein
LVIWERLLLLTASRANDLSLCFCILQR